MNAVDLRKKSVVELKTELVVLLKEQFKLRLMKQSDNGANQNHLFKVVKRNIARVLTIIAEKNNEDKE